MFKRSNNASNGKSESSIRSAKALAKLISLPLMASSVLFSSLSFASLELSGDVIQGGLVLGKTTPNSHVSLNGKTLQLSEQGNFVFGFGRDDKDPSNLLVTLPSGEKIEKTLTPSTREYKIQRVKGIAKRIMQPNPEHVARAKKDSKQVRAARAVISDQLAFNQGFVAPIEGIVTGVYGSQRFYNGKPGNPHYGVDYAGKIGDPVKAPADGVVTLYVPDMFYSGGTMIIDHGHGVNSTFLHLSDAYVKVGDSVKQGDVVAAVGNSGRTTGPHLDWRVNWFNTRIDPELVLTLKPLN